MKISLIVAAAENGVIGRAGGLPWRLKTDLGIFRKLTLGHPIIMGRKTYEAIGKPLDKRLNIVVSASGFTAPGTVAAASFEEALAIAEQAGGDVVFVIGGAQIFAASMQHANRLYWTRVHAAVEGDIRLPSPDPAEWAETSSERFEAGEGDDHAFTFTVLERVTKS